MFSQVQIPKFDHADEILRLQCFFVVRLCRRPSPFPSVQVPSRSDAYPDRDSSM